MISVIIPTFNRAQRVVEAVQSVLDQTLPAMEIIVVDDGSCDETLRAVQPLQEYVTYVHQQNSGVSSARNRGIRMARGSWIAFLDSDDLWLPDKLQAQSSYLAEHPQMRICQTQEVWIRNGLRINPRKYHRKPSGHCFQYLLERCLISPSAVMIHRSIIEEIGLFDEALPACEDYDLWLRIGCRHPIGLVDETLVVKNGGHSDQLSASIPSLDKYRIRSLVNLVFNEPLSREQGKQALQALESKCRIYASGCTKRGKTEEARQFIELPRMVQETVPKTLSAIS